MAKILDIKSTINLPRTEFSMKAQLPQREPQQLAQWEQQGLYKRILESRASSQVFMLHDGPPYATGDLHIGTGLNKVLKDMVVKSKTMAGFLAPYIPGWDCHGLPIESKVEKQLGGKNGKVSPSEFRRMCREFATKFIDQNRSDFKRLGIFGRWEKPYLTMDFEHEASIADAFLTFVEKGYVYKGLKPVYWCLHDRTALAEAEVEYHDHTSPSIYVRYKMVQEGASAVKIPPQLKGKNVYAIIWTTTPWTIPASMALAFHPDFEYAAVETPGGEIYIVAQQRRHEVAAESGYQDAGKALGTFKGVAFEGIEFRHPFLERLEPGVLADYVTLDQGTGIVHTAPGHGAEDFRTGQKYNIPAYAPLDDDGRFTEGLPEYKGKTVFEANPLIIQLLESRGALLTHGKLQHSYPHCWRCHNPVIFRATEQWFINLEHADLRKRALEEIRKVKWKPEWGEERIRGMVAERPDWCVSRQRFWGVPLVVFTCEKCGEQLKDFAALRSVVRWFEKEGADAWFSHPAEELLPRGTKCKCGDSRWRKENDILDVWFDAGSTNLAVLSVKDGTWPADVYLEGPDQYRGWFQSSLLVGIGVRGAAPYKQVVTHGWTLDAAGEPMSKSKGNFVGPREVCDKWGADLMRLWVASLDYFADHRWSDAVMTQHAESYRKIRNTFRFALGNLAGFDPARDTVGDNELWEMDAWMLHRAAELVKRCRAEYDEFEFHRVFHELHDFCVVDLSAFYFDVLKDRLYTFAPRNVGRRSAQTAIYRIAGALVRMVAPILVFTAEEVWKFLPHAANDRESVHVALFPKPEELISKFDSQKAGAWERLLELRSEALKVLEQARAAKVISGSLEASVMLEADGELQDLARRYASKLREILIVSEASLAKDGAMAGAVQSGTLKGLKILVRPAAGKKCERCWNYSTHVGESADYPTLCERCLVAIAEIERDGASERSARP
ncbi:MAG TPA: isoleucine--tRNA ligase [Candidatus Acidoferrales bacterium]|nr:isoleucine--tRNA ligase [Candidatus Acidoferrales bacterium]